MGEFNKTKSLGSSASQRQIHLNWDSLDGGGVFMIFGDEILLIRVRSNIISLLNKNHCNERTPKDRFTKIR